MPRCGGLVLHRRTGAPADRCRAGDISTPAPRKPALSRGETRGSRVPGPSGLVQMAAPSQPAFASHAGAVCPIVGTLPASPAASSGTDMGRMATRHINGGAGWWQSPCPVPVRASGEQSPGAARPPRASHQHGGVMARGGGARAWQFLKRNPGYGTAWRARPPAAKSEDAPFPIWRRCEAGREQAPRHHPSGDGAGERRDARDSPAIAEGARGKPSGGGSRRSPRPGTTPRQGVFHRCGRAAAIPRPGRCVPRVRCICRAARPEIVPSGGPRADVSCRFFVLPAPGDSGADGFRAAVEGPGGD